MLASQGQSTADAVRAIEVTEVTHHRWRQEYGGLKSDQVRNLKDIEAENARLRQAVAELTRDKMILKEAARGHWQQAADFIAKSRWRAQPATATKAGKLYLPAIQGLGADHIRHSSK